MQTSAIQSNHTIYTKTPKGHDEIMRRDFGLNIRQRRVLIMIDGTKNLSAIKELVPKDGLDEIIYFLSDQNFIAATALRNVTILTAASDATRPIAAAHADRQPMAAPTGNVVNIPKRPLPEKQNDMTLLQDPEKIREIKDFMTTTASTYLGLLSADVIQRIERAKTAAQLLTVVGYWHMALRDSKQGNRFAGPYMDQVTGALTGKAVRHEAIQA